MIARCLLVVTALLFLPGCELFMSGGARTASGKALPWTKSKADPSTDPAPILKMVRLEAIIVNRPASDARIQRHVWEELDESGIMAPDIRQQLNRTGFRIGVAASSTPRELQSLAKDAVSAQREDDLQYAPTTIQQGGFGSIFSLMQNGKSVIEAQSQLDTLKLPLRNLPELTSLRDQSELRCVFEIAVKELTDDWAILSVLPQIHAGAAMPRLSVQGTSEQLPVRQNVVSLYEHQFDVKLLTGEVAVIGRHDTANWNLGRLFFEPESGSSASTRLLMIRMIAIDRIRGKSDPSFRLGAYDKR